MGTVVSYRLEPGQLSEDEALDALAASTSELHRLDDLFSTWKPDSPMSRLRRDELAAPVPGEIEIVLELCAAAKDVTGGWFDPWAMPGGVDPTGLVKGWALERAADALRARGVRAAMVNGGGDIVTFGTRTPPADEPGAPEARAEGAFESTWPIGIRHPWRPEALACVVLLESGGSIATSGTYERGDHLIDPFASPSGAARAGLRHPGDRRVVSASVVGASLAMADAFATALAVAGAEGAELAERLITLGYESYRIFEDGAEDSTPRFPLAEAAARS